MAIFTNVKAKLKQVAINAAAKARETAATAATYAGQKAATAATYAGQKAATAATYAGKTALGAAKMTPAGRAASFASGFVPQSVKNAAKGHAQTMKNAAMANMQRRLSRSSQGGRRTRRHKNKRHTRRN